MKHDAEGIAVRGGKSSRKNDERGREIRRLTTGQSEQKKREETSPPKEIRRKEEKRKGGSTVHLTLGRLGSQEFVASGGIGRHHEAWLRRGKPRTDFVGPRRPGVERSVREREREKKEMS